MLHIKIIALGKLKESHWKDAEAEYSKRLRPYAKIDIIELKEEAFRDGDDKEKIKEKEASKIEKYIDASAVTVALHEQGKEMDSPQLAKWIEQNTTTGKTITFLIGGPLGFHRSILEKVDMQLSLSPLTFPHQMVRPILLEQLYRSATITHNKQYHY